MKLHCLSDQLNPLMDAAVSGSNTTGHHLQYSMPGAKGNNKGLCYKVVTLAVANTQ